MVTFWREHTHTHITLNDKKQIIIIISSPVSSVTHDAYMDTIKRTNALLF